MPQLDKATFFPVLFWSLVLYVGGYLLLNTSDLFTFLSALKFKKKRLKIAYNRVIAKRRVESTVLAYPALGEVADSIE